ncbi:SDR family oxidoreductase [Aurantimonas sp. MSK8Z-1]|uniref:SDR family oxidoreductase n=1 Tax=Mangrovibrevibacter kandeliae TaxID=2968473 RepID=UPI0021195187|nr:SDR family oxidoreductase [Aurantimonas sp. MSK8Z-1]MCW4116062.1 SDR family oxidoreductase [Aurantimonas sp. MSK8Z-1]
MRVFVTGASGWVGSAVTAELIAAGHEVLGLARSDASAAKVAALGARVHRGSLDAPDTLAAGVREADAVIHTAYVHDFPNFASSAETEEANLAAMGDALKGSGKPFIVTSGLALHVPGRAVTEEDAGDPSGSHAFRVRGEHQALALVEDGVRAMVVRLPPSTHGEGDYGFVPIVIRLAREKGVSAYVGDGENRWPAVHRLDAARLYRLALEKGEPGQRFHAVGDAGIPTREIAAAIGRGLDLPVVSVPPERAGEHFGWMGGFLGFDIDVSADLTRQRLGWKAEQPGLIADLEEGHYFRSEG